MTANTAYRSTPAIYVARRWKSQSKTPPGHDAAPPNVPKLRPNKLHPSHSALTITTGSKPKSHGHTAINRRRCQNRVRSFPTVTNGSTSSNSTTSSKSECRSTQLPGSNCSPPTDTTSQSSPWNEVAMPLRSGYIAGLLNIGLRSDYPGNCSTQPQPSSTTSLTDAAVPTAENMPYQRGLSVRPT